MSHPRHRSLRRCLAALPLLALLALSAAPAAADEYDARRAGHPLRVVAYVLHPVGVALDYLLFRPAHWVGSQPVVRTIFGHDVDEQPQR
jgi:hypothetical protein